MVKKSPPTTPTKKSVSTKKSVAPKGSASKAAKPLQASTKREVIYPQVQVRLCQEPKPLTVAMAKELLGWQPESENIKFGNAFLLNDFTGAKVRCFNNVINRPLYRSQLALLKQEILRRNWRLNGEPIIIGATGLVLNGQHTLLALILASQEWEAQRGKWKGFWEVEPTIEKLVITGIDEQDETVNTMDTCKARSFADVLYRSHHFADRKEHERRNLARITDYAVRMLWDRTGAGEGAYSIFRTHSESLALIERHPRLLASVAHIFEENGTENHIRQLAGSVGAAAGLLYLMASSKTEREKSTNDGYAQVDLPSEAQLDFSRWDAACEFWVLLAANAREMQIVRDVLAGMLAECKTTSLERISLVILAWNAFIAKKPLTEKSLELSYIADGDGELHLAEYPTLGGIDIGKTQPQLD